MIKAGATAYHRLKFSIDPAALDSAIVTYAAYASERVLLQRRYPEDIEASGGMFIIPLTQEDTVLLGEGGENIRIEIQFNFKSGDVAKSQIQMARIQPTLATEFIDGNRPSIMPDTVYDFETDEVIYIKGEKGDKGDTGERGERGATPYIGPNGNWWIDGKDTGSLATYRLIAEEQGTALEIKLVPSINN